MAARPPPSTPAPASPHLRPCQVAEEKQGETRRSSWQNFSKKNKTCKSAKNGHDPNWDPTRDHGELAARLQMEKYSSYLAREGAS